MKRPAFILGLPQRDGERLPLAAVERFQAGAIDRFTKAQAEARVPTQLDLLGGLR